MNVLILGSGGREHALAWKISQSPLLHKMFVAPGNAGTKEFGTNVELDILDFDQIGKFALQNKVELIVVGPEIPLVHGITDYFESKAELENIRVLGPNAEGAKLEGSKEYAKKFMQKYNIPTAGYQSFSSKEVLYAKKYLRKLRRPYVLKADGLAGGKGVIIESNLQKAEIALDELLNGQFGEASRKVVIEEFLKGVELSVFVLTDGNSYKILPEAKDYKRIGEGDTGLNTGGMGAISPVPFADEKFMTKVKKFIIEPTIEGLATEGINYQGFLFFGLMNKKGLPYVIEYNVRMGDPETEAVMLRIESDFLELLDAASKKTLESKEIKISPKTAASVMLVSAGYPEAYKKNKEITGCELNEDSILFHAGTIETDGKVLTNGGRVLAISSYGNSLNEALKKSYNIAERIDFEGKTYRKDLGFDL